MNLVSPIQKVYMKTMTLLFASLVALTSTPEARPGTSTPDLMPLPERIQLNEGRFAVEPDLAVSLSGEGATKRLERGVRRMLRRLSDRSTIFFDPATFLDFTEGRQASVQIRAEREGRLALGEDEAYSLAVSPGGIRLQAATDIGALRGLETLLQLLQLDEEGVYFPAVTVDDRPRFPWRGLMIDSSRHFMPLEVL